MMNPDGVYLGNYRGSLLGEENVQKLISNVVIDMFIGFMPDNNRNAVTGTKLPEPK